MSREAQEPFSDTTMRSRRWTNITETGTTRAAAIALAQALFIAAALYVFLRGWERDFRVPLYFTSDGLLALMQSKSTVDNGWWWLNPMLGAPFEFDQIAFPANSNVDQAVVWLVSRFVSHPAAAINLAWMVIVVLGGLSATWCMRRLGASTISSVAAGTLFTLSPYALYRHIAHFWMVVYLVPFACTAALLLATGRVDGRPTRKPLIVLLLGCALLGFNYVYYAFFACFFIVTASLVGLAARRDWRIARAGTLYVALIVSCTMLNLAPSLYSWHQHGKPIILRDKVPAESEVYGLKIRQLVSPVVNYSFGPFRWWLHRESEAQFPLETENRTSRLGVIATLGFLGVLGLLMTPGVGEGAGRGRTMQCASRLTIAGVLLATIGGFGSLFSLLVSSDIRAYNRITPFIAFFSLVIVALALDWLTRSRGLRLVAAACVLGVGLADQRVSAASLNALYPDIAAEIASLEGFVREIEARLPDRAMVLQLPFRPYLNDSGVGRMQPYDHLKMYVLSRTLRWSYPAFSNEQVRWQLAAARLEAGVLLHEVAQEGFSAILVDRYGYDDGGAAVIGALRAGVDRGAVLAETDRYVALDIRPLIQSGARTSTRLRATPAPATLAMPACGGQTVAMVDRIANARPPFFDRVVRLRASNPLKITGWAVDERSGLPARDVDIAVDRTTFPTFYGLDRADVAAHFNRRAYVATGFAAEIPKGSLSTGRHALSFRVVSSGGSCFYETAAIAIAVE